MVSVSDNRVLEISGGLGTVEHGDDGDVIYISNMRISSAML
jgi:hypothetical protein